MHAKLAAVLAIGAAGCLRPSNPKEADAPAHAAEANVRRSAGIGEISVCLIENGELKAVAAEIVPTTGDTLLRGRPLEEAHPVTLPPYARDAAWLATQIIDVKGKSYAPHGPPQVIAPELLTRVGEFRGVPVFAEAGLANEGEGAIFIPIRPGCEFQPYVANVDVL